MKTQEFTALSLEEQIVFINRRLSEGVSFNQIVRDLKVPKTTLLNRIQRSYRKEGNSYVPLNHGGPVNNGDAAGNSASLPPGDIQLNGTDLEEMKARLDTIPIILSGVQKLKEDLAILKEQNAHLLMAPASYSNGIQPPEPNVLNIELPEAPDNYVSFRVNREVLRRWYAFIRKQSGYSSCDLISAALLEFLDRYEK